MRRFFILSLCITFSLLAFPKSEKVIDSSAKRMPSWVFGMENGYIITSAEASTMDAARSLAMQQVKERILSSVAEHVESETAISNSETVTESDIQSLSVFAKQIKTKSADVPFLKNVSEAHVTDYYWEKIQKRDKQIVYVYNIKYPFSELEIRLIIKEWQAQHKLSDLQAADFDAKLDEYRELKLTSMTSVDQMLDAVNAVAQLQNQLPDQENRRKDACGAVLEEYKRQLAGIQIRLKNITREYVEYELYLGADKVSCQALPQMQSNCLTQMQFEPQTNGGRIRYNFELGCYEDESNYIEISYTFAGKKVSNKFYVSGTPSAQANNGNGEQRVALTAVVLDNTIPAAAAKQLVNKMQQMALKGGYVGMDKGRYVITCTVDELTKEVLSTAPVMYAYAFNFNFYIGDGVEGVLYAATSVQAKGIGETPAKAYLSALKNIQPNNPAFKAFVEKGRKRMVEPAQEPVQQEYKLVNEWRE